jgi:23S rRNA-/tRNA-specific pseudouridylate synthase
MRTKPDARHVARAGPGDAGARLDKFLAGALTGLSRTRIKALIEAGRLAADGATIADPSQPVKPGRRYQLTVPAAVPAAPRGQVIALDVVYEDADLIVIDKRAGMVVHPAPGNPDSTLQRIDGRGQKRRRPCRPRRPVRHPHADARLPGRGVGRAQPDRRRDRRQHRP